MRKLKESKNSCQVHPVQILVRYTLAKLSDKEKKAGVIAASAGNHAQVGFQNPYEEKLLKPQSGRGISWRSDGHPGYRCDASCGAHHEG